MTQNRTHNAVHELTAIDSSPLTYDAKGNLTGDEAGIAYAWDADNMLSEADVPATPDRGIEGSHTYAYDALGRRVTGTVDDAVGMTTTTTVFVCLTQPIPYSPWAGQVLAEYGSGTAAGSPLRKYAYGEHIDEPLVMVDRTAAGSTGAGTDEAFYYHRNQQYSVAALSDSGGNITERYRYTPYGETTILAANGTTVRTASDVGNAYTYTGRRLDGESDLHYFRKRYVLSPEGRFLNRDPLRYVDGASLYRAYFAYRGIDPSGLDLVFEYPDPGGSSDLIDEMLEDPFPQPQPPPRSLPKPLREPYPDPTGGRAGAPFPGVGEPPMWHKMWSGDLTNYCIWPNTKDKTVAGNPLPNAKPLPNAGPVGVIGGEYKLYPGLPREGELYGTGGCATCVGVVIKCPKGVAVYHFHTGNSVTSLDNYSWPKGCKAIACGGDGSSHLSNCLLDAVVNKLKSSRNISLEGVSSASSCYVGSDGGWHVR